MEKRGDVTFTTTYHYYKADLLESYEVKDQNNVLLEKVTYTHDNAGNRLTEVHEGAEPKTIENTYNTLNQLMESITTDTQTQTQTQTYSYDPAGRLLSSRKSEPGNQNPAVATYSYNNWGQLANYSGPGGTATYSYSYNNQRISSYENGTLTDFTYHGNELFETYTGSHRVSKYVHSPMGTVGVYNATNTYNGLVTDTQNSIIGILNSTLNTQNSTLSQSYAYSPFGGVRYQQSDSFKSSLQWLSRHYDETSGNHYLMNRYYNASTGRFNSTDWYEYVDTDMPYSMNLYQYGYGNAGKYMDRDGLKAAVKKLDSITLFQEKKDLFITQNYLMTFLGGLTSDVYYIYDDGEYPVEIDNNKIPVAISFGVGTKEYKIPKEQKSNSSEYYSGKEIEKYLNSGLGTAEAMAKDLKRPAYYITNQTKLFYIGDLIEAGLTKFFGINSNTVNAMKKVLSGEYENLLIETKKDPIQLKVPNEWIVHSQGGINLAESLKEVDPSIFKKYEIIVNTFGAAAYSYVNGPKQYFHYTSWYDPVSGLLGKTFNKYDPISISLGIAHNNLRTDEKKIIGDMGFHMFMQGYWQQYLYDNQYDEAYFKYCDKDTKRLMKGLKKFNTVNDSDKKNKGEMTWSENYAAIQGYYLY